MKNGTKLALNTLLITDRINDMPHYDTNFINWKDEDNSFDACKAVHSCVIWIVHKKLHSNYSQEVHAA